VGSSRFGWLVVSVVSAVLISSRLLFAYIRVYRPAATGPRPNIIIGISGR